MLSPTSPYRGMQLPTQVGDKTDASQPAAPQAAAPELSVDYKRAIDDFHNALLNEFTKPPFTVQAQMTLNRIEKIKLQLENAGRPTP